MGEVRAFAQLRHEEADELHAHDELGTIALMAKFNVVRVGKLGNDVIRRIR